MRLYGIQDCFGKSEVPSCGRKPALRAFRGGNSAISLQTIAQRDDSGQMVFDGLHELTGPGAREGALVYDLASRYSVFAILLHQFWLYPFWLLQYQCI